ncbi:MAG: HAD-IB family hydrolase [Desulfobacterium sp.]|nr:HAD-IB family hydrolase [Desulfobacterium sp.]
MTPIAAFFDFDRTLVDADSQRTEALSLAGNPPVPIYPLRLLKAAAAGPLHKRALISHDQYNRIYLSTYKGIPLSFLSRLGQTLYRKKLKPLLFPEMAQVIQTHREQGHLIILVSATSRHLLEPYVRDLKPDAWAATKIATDPAGVCTGNPLGEICLGPEKARIVERLARKMEIDLSRSHAYSDHHADLEFLETVGRPVAVNPTPMLAGIAAQRNWAVKRPHCQAKAFEF